MDMSNDIIKFKDYTISNNSDDLTPKDNNELDSKFKSEKDRINSTKHLKNNTSYINDNRPITTDLGDVNSSELINDTGEISKSEILDFEEFLNNTDSPKE